MLQSQRQPPKLLEQVRTAIRTRHYSLRTEETSLSWIKRFILFHGKRHPRDMGVQEVHQFLSHLAVEGQVAASTQSQALSAILFLYQQVLQQDIGWLHDVVRAKHPQRLPVVLTQDEVAKVLRQLSGVPMLPQPVKTPLQQHLQKAAASLYGPHRRLDRRELPVARVDNPRS
jgi:site-specific recombinase XerD